MKPRNVLTLLRVVVLAASVLAMAAGVRADMIPYAYTGVSGKAFRQGDSADPGNGSISRLFGGQGLTVGNPLLPSTWTHDNQWPNNWQGDGSFTPSGNTAPTPGAWLVADFGSVHKDMGFMYVWNVREALERGAKVVALYYATTPTVPPVTGSAYNFASGGWTGFGTYTINQATGGGTPADNVFDLRGIASAQYIGFDIQSDWGSNFRVGFAELQFQSAPEPCTLSLLALGGLCLLRRRRKA